MNTPDERLPKQLEAAREAYRTQRYSGARPDFAALAQPRRRWIALAAAASVLAATGVVWLLGAGDPGGQDPAPARWSAIHAPDGGGLVTVPRIARPALPARPEMPAAPRREGGFASAGDVG